MAGKSIVFKLGFAKVLAQTDQAQEPRQTDQAQLRTVHGEGDHHICQPHGLASTAASVNV